MVAWFVLGALSLASLTLTIWQWIEGCLFHFHEPAPRSGELASAADVAGNRRSAVRPELTAGARGVTLLKPLKGSDAQTEVCLRSWFEQEYQGPVQLLFGIQTDDDPAGVVVRKLIAQFTDADAQLIVCRERIGPNAKVNKLAQLEPLAKYDLVVVSDADVRAPRQFVTALVAAFEKPTVGLVNALYRLDAPITLAMRWEALAVNADFWTGVLQSRRIEPMRFALGAVMAVRRRHVRDMGGFGILADHLADDFELGRRVASQGALVELSPVVVDCCHAPQPWTTVWRHQLRWARTIRACRPVGYGLSLLSNASLWPLLWIGLCPGLWSGVGAGLCLAVRVLTAFDNQRRLTGSSAHLRWLWLALVKDILSVALWVLAFAGSVVEWRGERYRIQRNGTIELTD